MEILLYLILVIVIIVVFYLLSAILELTNLTPQHMAQRLAKSFTKQLRHDMYYRDWRSTFVLDFNNVYGVDFIPDWTYSAPKWFREIRDPFLVNKYLKQVAAHYKKVMEEAGLQMSLKDFVWRYMSLNLGHYSYADESGRVYDETLVVPIEEYAQLLKNDISLKRAAKLYQYGLTIEQIIEYHDMPVEWTANLYSNRELKDNSNSY